MKNLTKRKIFKNFKLSLKFFVFVHRDVAQQNRKIKRIDEIIDKMKIENENLKKIFE